MVVVFGLVAWIKRLWWLGVQWLWMVVVLGDCGKEGGGKRKKFILCGDF